MVKDSLVIADLGAASNLIKNLLYLGDYYWPLAGDKFIQISNQYRPDLELDHWLEQEYKLRFWQEKFGIDLSDDLDFGKYMRTLSTREYSAVFVNHSAFWQQDKFLEFAERTDYIYIMPFSIVGLEWQIRAYCEKKTIPLLHDFSFVSNREVEITKFKQEFGDSAYYEMNIANMIDIMKNRQTQFYKVIDHNRVLALEDVLLNDPNVLCKILCELFDQDLPKNQVTSVIESWRSLHWPFDKTAAWQFHHLFT